MAKAERTTMIISHETKKKLHDLKEYGDSYEKVILKLIKKH